ncbi:hypothetical protein [uncultured Helicobacter sp.]|uniref:hypothetical protein n=1 Tax=uncultured Helicobacter sp. TaxID=175537 RepID=UPI00260929A6|nr:hypothetical protein [uncultured Helicobacter sp.]
MESYENLRLEQKDKIQKRNFWEKLFKKESNISEENLDFLEERYAKANQEFIYKDSKAQEPEENLISLDNFLLKRKMGNSFQSTESQTTSLNLEEKEAVLEVDLNYKEIPFKSVCLVFVFMFIALLIFVPKIYVRNNIYYTSRNLIQLQAQLDSLNEENKHIKKQLEDIKFKNLTHELDF